MLIWMYHGIVPDSEADSLLSYGQITASSFERHMRWLKKYSTVLPLTAIVERFREDRRLPRNATAITFDDGFQNNVDIAYPILQKYELPATVFVTTSHLEPCHLLWFNWFIAQAFVSESSGEPSPLQIERLKRQLDQFERDGQWCLLRSEEHYAAPQAVSQKQLAATVAGMTRQQLQQLAESDLMEIGSHSVTHPKLTECSQEQLVDELTASKRELEAITQQPIRFFAYPLGACSPTVAAAVRRAGYEAGLGVDVPKSCSPDLFCLPRIGLYGNSQLQFLAKWLGLQRLVRWLRKPYSALTKR